MRNTALSEQKKHCRTKTITQEILKTIVKRERILVLTGQGKLAVRPGITDGLVYNPFKKEPESPLK
ncbi:hypothetical protein [Chitinophaga sp. CF118]|uniref:hypothetical protein n=1 Tax=Chitinophaga sp. CF118 TaxID=1884367 RepID=UPI001160C0EC|nr:hypothetical protein [Chitinophaga sp. CF118]